MPTLETPLCTRLGIDVPIVGAGMGGASGPELAAAVSNAGALGTLALGTGRQGPDRIAEAIARCRALTDRPFSVNFIAYDLAARPEALAAALDAGVPSVTLSFVDPAPFAPAIHEAGALLITQVQSLARAREALAAGSDVVIAQGAEAGGHTGEVGTLALVPQVVDLAGEVPVVAAGGIADGRGLAAVLALGAQGAVLGTALLAAEETQAYGPRHRALILAADADATVYTQLYDVIAGDGRSPWPEGIAGRAIRTPFSDRWHGRAHDLLAAGASAIGERGSGDERDPTPYYAGPAAGLVRAVRPAAEIVDDVVRGARDVLARLA